MTRRLLNLLTLLSLLLCVAVVVLWVRSYPTRTVIIHETRNGARGVSHVLASQEGRLVYVRSSHQFAGEREAEVALAEYPPFSFRENTLPWAVAFRPLPALFPGFVAEQKSHPSRQDFRLVRVGVPYWCLALLFALPPAGAGTRRARRRRPRAGRACHSCGYNLTGNVSGVCPECGRAST